MIRTLSATLLTVFFVFITFFNSSAQQGISPVKKSYINKYGSVYNSDRTLRLGYIAHYDQSTLLVVYYTGTSNIGSFTGIYLDNFRIVDKNTGTEYRPKSTNKIPSDKNSKFFLYNSGEEIMLGIEFNRLPASATLIDFIEGDGSSTSTYNFTFRNIRLDPSKDVTDDISDDLFDDEGYYATFYTFQDMTIDIRVDDVYVGKIERFFKNKDYRPSCGEFGTFLLCFGNNKKRKISASATYKSEKFNWDFEFTPRQGDEDCYSEYFKTQ